MKTHFFAKGFKIIFLVCLIVFALMFCCVGAKQTSFVETNVEVCAALTTSQIKTVQTKLKNWGYYTGAVDGIYGPKTKAAVKSFQKKNGLTADGIVGNKTAAALGMSLSSSSSKTSAQNSNDVYLLAKCIHAEARG